MQISTDRFSGLICKGCLDYLLAGYLVSFMALESMLFLFDDYAFVDVTFIKIPVVSCGSAYGISMLETTIPIILDVDMIFLRLSAYHLHHICIAITNYNLRT